MVKRRFGAALCALLVTACSNGGSRHPTPEDAELSSLQPFKARYPDVVMGFDPKGRVLDVSIDLNGMMSMGESNEDHMKRDALTAWTNAWKAANRGHHGTLIVRIIDFKGDLEYKESTSV